MKVLILALSVILANDQSSKNQEPVCSEVDGGMVCSLGERVKPKKLNPYAKCKEIEPGIKACYV